MISLMQIVSTSDKILYYGTFQTYSGNSSQRDIHGCLKKSSRIQYLEKGSFDVPEGSFGWKLPGHVNKNSNGDIFLHKIRILLINPLAVTAAVLKFSNDTILHGVHGSALSPFVVAHQSQCPRRALSLTSKDHHRHCPPSSMPQPSIVSHKQRASPSLWLF